MSGRARAVGTSGSPTLWRDAALIAAKDLRIERSSKVVTVQILPFGLLVLVLFGFALSPEPRVSLGEGVPSRAVLEHVAPGLFWLAVVFSALLAVNRSFAVEAADGNLDALHLAGVEPGGVFLGKAAAVAAQLVALEVVLGIGAFVLYGPPVASVVLLVVTAVCATVGVASAGTLYGALGAGQRVRDTLTPLLVLPVLAPVVLGAARATESALFGPVGEGWSWVGVLGAFAALYLTAGILLFGPVLDET